MKCSDGFITIGWLLCNYWRWEIRFDFLMRLSINKFALFSISSTTFTRVWSGFLCCSIIFPLKTSHSKDSLSTETDLWIIFFRLRIKNVYEIFTSSLIRYQTSWVRLRRFEMPIYKGRHFYGASFTGFFPVFVPVFLSWRQIFITNDWLLGVYWPAIYRSLMKRDGDADWCQHGSTRWPEMRTDRYGGGQKRGMEAEGGGGGIRPLATIWWVSAASMNADERLHPSTQRPLPSRGRREAAGRRRTATKRRGPWSMASVAAFTVIVAVAFFFYLPSPLLPASRLNWIIIINPLLSLELCCCRALFFLFALGPGVGWLLLGRRVPTLSFVWNGTTNGNRKRPGNSEDGRQQQRSTKSRPPSPGAAVITRDLHSPDYRNSGIP